LLYVPGIDEIEVHDVTVRELSGKLEQFWFAQFVEPTFGSVGLYVFAKRKIDAAVS
jgi:hypothetical protein